MLVRGRHLLLRLLKIRAIVGSKEIFEIPAATPIIIPCRNPVTSVIISNGFHFSRELEVTRVPYTTFFYQVDCRIDDIQLYYLAFLCFLFFGVFILTDMRIFMLLANIPILYLMFVLYIQRKNFIVITAVGMKAKE